MAKMCGYVVDEVIDTEFASFFHPDNIAQIERICAKVISNANAIEVHDITLLCKNGLKLNAEITAGYFVYNQHPAVLVIVRDISDGVRSEKEQIKSKKLDSISALSNGIAHDYNNLLTAIIGNISLARVNLSSEHQAFKLLSQALAASETAKYLTQGRYVKIYFEDHGHGSRRYRYLIQWILHRSLRNGLSSVWLQGYCP